MDSNRRGFLACCGAAALGLAGVKSAGTCERKALDFEFWMLEEGATELSVVADFHKALRSGRFEPFKIDGDGFYFPYVRRENVIRCGKWWVNWHGTRIGRLPDEAIAWHPSINCLAPRRTLGNPYLAPRFAQTLTVPRRLS